MSKRAFVSLFTIAMLTVCVSAQDGEEKRLGVDLDATYVSQYMWRGYDILDGDPAFQPSVNFDLFQTGFSLNVWGSFGLSSGSEDYDELDYTLAWGRTFFEDAAYAIDFSANYIYYDYPNVDSENADVQEIGVGISLPNLAPVGPGYLVPSYYAGYDWSAYSGGPEEGWFHIFGLGYDLPIPALLPDQEEQALSFTADLTYNDGAFDSDPCWSHTTAGLATNFEWKGFTLTPSVNYQWSLDDSVNDEDEFWAGISLAYSF
ncbi:MAG: hypothetical protein ABIH23_29665 [bacterium]